MATRKAPQKKVATPTPTLQHSNTRETQFELFDRVAVSLACRAEDHGIVMDYRGYQADFIAPDKARLHLPAPGSHAERTIIVRVPARLALEVVEE